MKSDPLHVHGARWGPGPGCLLALCSHSLHSPLSSHLPSHATMSSHMLLPGSGASFASSSSSSKGEGACCAPGTVLSILFTLSHEVGTIISLHLTGDKDKISSGRLCSQIHALLQPQASSLPKTFFPPQSGVDPQLYVTITISIIIVLVATGIIFKFW